MKKITLGLSALALALGASAKENPAIVPDVAIMGFSPDNKACVGEIMNTVFIFDMNDLTAPKIFEENEEGTVGYSVGSGNFIGNNTLVLQRVADGASAWTWSADGSIINGRWRTLNTGAITAMGSPNGVTADGSRICGNMAGNGQFGQENVTYTLPCYWDVEGSTFTRTALEHPDKDYAGLAPQYVTALAISDDGKTIIGQLVSNNGFLCEYIVYKQADDGKWSYVKPFADQVNPHHLVLPEYPGEGPTIPTAEAYLTAEEKAAFDKAMQAYENGQGEEPDAEDYLTDPAARAAYLAAIAEYNEWGKKYNEYDTVDRQILLQSISFVFNQGSISPDGHYFATSAKKSYMEADGNYYDVYEPILYDLEKMEQVTIPIEAPDQPGYALSLLVTGVSNNGDLVGYERMSDIDFGYILKAGDTKWTPLEEYVVELQPSMADWVNKNWCHTIQVLVDEEEDIYEYQDLVITGLPFMSRDFTQLSTVAYSFWDDGDEALYNRYLSYVIDLNAEASIREVSAAKSDSGNDVWYNLQGRKVVKPTSAGIYLRNGEKVVVK